VGGEVFNELEGLALGLALSAEGLTGEGCPRLATAGRLFDEVVVDWRWRKDGQSD